jgi:protein-tyrosine phosphatase
MKIEVLSQFLFDEKMENNGLNDDNVENENMAFISIIGTKECLEYYLDEGKTKHYFKDHPNVLNLDFDDIGTHVNYNGHLFKTMTIEQAEKTVEFIEDMIEKGVEGIIIHCRAGYSRSRAIAEFIYRYCQENNMEVEYSDRNDFRTMLNQGVLNKLNHAYWKKHKMNCYSNGEEYDDELINIPIIDIKSNG